MLWPSDKSDLPYRMMVEQAAKGSGACTVVMFVGLDVDALCACRILTGLFKVDGVGYRIVPVRSKADVLGSWSALKGKEEVRSIVMLNCGGDLVLHDVFGLVDPSMFCYVLDAHRPLHHANLQPRADLTVVFGDPFADEAALKAAAEELDELSDADVERVFAALSDEEDESSDGSGSDGEEGEGDEKPGDDQGGEDDDDDDDDEEEAEAELGVTSHGNKENVGLFSQAEQQAIEAELGAGQKRPAAAAGSPSAAGRRKRRSGSASSGEGLQGGVAGRREEEEQHEPPPQEAAQAAARDAARAQPPQQHGGSIKERAVRYYSGTAWGTPASHLAFVLAQQLNRGSRYFLWLAIVGTAAHQALGHIGEEAYHELLTTYHELVKDRSVEARARGVFATEDRIAVHVAEQDRIEFSEEYHLPLFRHWSLREAFLFSDHVNCKLALWRNDGEAQLSTLFAKMGVSLRESEQMHSFTSVKLRHSLRDKLDRHGASFGLGEDFVFGSFQYRAGFHTQLSAADAALAVAALLDGFATADETVAVRARAQRRRQAQELDQQLPPAGGGGAGGAGGAGAAPGSAGDADADAELGADADRQRLEDLWQESFNQAYDALEFSAVGNRSRELLERGLELAKLLQRAMIEEGHQIMTGQRIASAGDFRYCILDGLAPKLASVFSQPMMLMRLTRFVMAANAGRWKGSAAKPLVMCIKGVGAGGALPDGTGAAYFAGLPCPSDNGHVPRNAFGRQFKEAAALVNAGFRASGYDAAVAEVALDNVQQFLVALHEVVSR